MTSNLYVYTPSDTEEFDLQSIVCSSDHSTCKILCPPHAGLSLHWKSVRWGCECLSAMS